jgi:uncharacterized protein (DUF433 family)
MNSYAHIETNPEICNGKPHIKGTRITVGLIATEVESLRMSPDEIVTTHPHLTLAQVHSALAYFYDHRGEIENLMRDAEIIEEELRARFPSRIKELLSLQG